MNNQEQLFEYVLLIPAKSEGREKNVFEALAPVSIPGYTNVMDQPHIPLLHFKQYESVEFRISNCLQKFARMVQAPQLGIEELDELFETHRNIQGDARTAIQSIVQELKLRYRKLLTPHENLKPKFISTPTIAATHSLSSLRFSQLAGGYESSVLTPSFVCQEMMLLKREFNPDRPSSYRPVKHFPFGCKLKVIPEGLTKEPISSHLLR